MSNSNVLMENTVFISNDLSMTKNHLIWSKNLLNYQQKHLPFNFMGLDELKMIDI